MDAGLTWRQVPSSGTEWRVVRASRRSSTSAVQMGASLYRVALGHIVDRSLALVEHLREGGPGAVHNMDALLLRESMDVIGARPLAALPLLAQLRLRAAPLHVCFICDI